MFIYFEILFKWKPIQPLRTWKSILIFVTIDSCPFREGNPETIQLVVLISLKLLPVWKYFRTRIFRKKDVSSVIIVFSETLLNKCNIAVNHKICLKKTSPPPLRNTSILHFFTPKLLPLGVRAMKFTLSCLLTLHLLHTKFGQSWPGSSWEDVNTRCKTPDTNP